MVSINGICDKKRQEVLRFPGLATLLGEKNLEENYQKIKSILAFVCVGPSRFSPIFLKVLVRGD